MYFGVDYHPEQWVYPYGGTAESPESSWQRDVELMAAAGINVVRIGEFTWGLCEREEGKYDFTWLGRVMDILGKADIKVVLATPTAAPLRDILLKLCRREELTREESRHAFAHLLDDSTTLVTEDDREGALRIIT
jgi:hypothetical protein